MCHPCSVNKDKSHIALTQSVLDAVVYDHLIELGVTFNVVRHHRHVYMAVNHVQIKEKSESLDYEATVSPSGGRERSRGSHELL